MQELAKILYGFAFLCGCVLLIWLFTLFITLLTKIPFWIIIVFVIIIVSYIIGDGFVDMDKKKTSKKNYDIMYDIDQAWNEDPNVGQNFDKDA